MALPSVSDHVIAPLIILFVVAAWVAVRYEFRKSARRKREAARLRGEPVQEPRAWPWRRGILASAGMAAVYLLVFRLISFIPSEHRDNAGGAILMSFSFLFLGPFVAGYITVDQAATKEPLPPRMWIAAPWIPILFNVALALAIAWEGVICAVFIIPPAMACATAGGFVAALVHGYRHKKTSNNALMCMALAPLLLCFVEARMKQPLELRTVNTQISIHAPAPVVWRNIERVRAIAPAELRTSWANTIGFPRPVEATLSFEGVGGVRDASFERGLTFTETVTDWQPGKRIAFTIAANTSAIPSTTLDEHVTVGGRFFDVLTGDYTLEPLPNGDTLLHLASHQRLSTDFNFYAAMWSNAVMSDMQNNILHVVRDRCEAEARAAITAAATTTRSSPPESSSTAAVR